MMRLDVLTPAGSVMVHLMAGFERTVVLPDAGWGFV